MMAALARILNKNAIYGVRSSVRHWTALRTTTWPMHISVSAPMRLKSDRSPIDRNDLSKVIKPISVGPADNPDAIDIGAELTGDSNMSKG